MQSICSIIVKRQAELCCAPAADYALAITLWRKRFQPGTSNGELIIILARIYNHGTQDDVRRDTAMRNFLSGKLTALEFLPPANLIDNALGLCSR